MKLITGMKLLYKKYFRPEESEWASFIIADKIAGWLYPKYHYGDFGKIWLDDREFFERFDRLEGANFQSADRKYLLRSLMGLVTHLPGDTAECGAYMGASSWLICDALRGSGKEHHVFDSFEGLSAPAEVDGTFWREGGLEAGLECIRRNLAEFNFVRYHKGWIPDTFPAVADKTFCLVHIDLDLHQPTFDSLAFFYPRMVPGGIILSDDYGFITCPGVTLAFDEYLKDKPEKLIHVPTGQSFIMKR